MKDASKLIEKLRKGTASEKEKELLDRWLHELGGNEPVSYSADEHAQIKERGRQMLSPYLIGERKQRLWPRLIAAASIAMAVFAGGYFYYKSEISKDKTEFSATNDIAPGKNGATLTLANGKKIYINDALAGNIASEAGVKISKTKDGQLIYEITGSNDSKILTYNTLTTTRGEQSQVRLPDGSLVFLNAESSLKYPTSFAKQERRLVSLSGEAYFEVAKDRSHPFIVSTNKQEVEVLGTHFNINAYPDKPQTKTTLLEGSVRVVNNESKVAEILSPGQQANVSGNKLDIAPADIDEAVAWKEGAFIYNKVPLEIIMADISRWYDVDVEFADVTLKQKIIYINGNRNANVSEFLKPLGRIAKIDFQIGKDKITVSKKKN